MESQPQDPEFRNNLEIYPCVPRSEMRPGYHFLIIRQWLNTMYMFQIYVL